MPHRPPRQERTTPEISFEGGISYLDHSQLKPNQHVVGQNWWLDRDNVVRPRPGNQRWTQGAPPGFEVQGLWDYRRQSDQVNRLMEFAGGILWEGNDGDGTVRQIKTGLSTTKRGWAFTAQDRFWFCDGIDTPLMYDGITGTVRRIGLVNPPSVPTVVLVALAGNLPAEEHFYQYTYVREEAGLKVLESNPSPESTKVTNDAANAQNDVTVKASPDANVTHIYIYRRSSVSVLDYKFVAKVSNSDQTYRDNILIASLGAFAFWSASGGEEDHGYPPATIFGFPIELHRDGRAFAWGPKSQLLYSRVLQFDRWPGASGGALNSTAVGIQLFIGEDDGDEGQALISEGDVLACLKRYNVYRLIGDGPSADNGLPGSWRVQKLPTTFGCAAPASAARGPAGTYWLSDASVVRIHDVRGVPIMIGRDILPWVKRSSDITKGVGWVWERYYFLFLPFGSRWEGHAYNVVNGSWWPMIGMDAQAFATREDQRLFWAGILEADK